MSDITYRAQQLMARLKALRNEEIYLWPQACQLIFLGLVYLVLQGGTLLLFIAPLKDEIQQSIHMEITRVQNINTLKQQLRLQPDLKAAVEELKQSSRSVVNSFSNQSKLNLLTEISEIARANNLNIIELSWGGEEKLDSLLKSVIAIELEGAYHDIGLFSQHITGLNPFVVLQNLSLKHSDKALIARIEALTYQLTTEEEMQP